ncbi:MAG: S-layer homology domain-containing protein [Clostridia bacterium]|nr:S-layer homology domain-containing protein [Clostridia bacterium]
MRNLKKMLSLVMALAMVASFMVVGASAQFTDDKDIVNKDAVETLVSLGVIKGRDTGAFDAKGIVTRAEMAKMICVAMNGGKDPNLTGTGSFPDTKNHWAAGYIDYCKNMGYIAGNTDGKFYPDKTVTGTEAAKMILTILGFNSKNEKFENDANWEMNINVAASTKGLYDNVSITPSAGLTRDDAAQMIYDGLQATMVKYVMVGIVNGNGVAQAEEYTDKRTILSTKFDLKTGYSYLSGVDYDSDKKEYEYTLTTVANFGSGAITGTDAYANTVKSTKDFSTLYGQKVRTLYKVDNSKTTVYGIYATDSSVLGTDIVGNLSVKAADTSVKVDGTSYKLTDDAANTPAFAYNNGSAGYALSAAPAAAKAFKYALIDNSGDGKGDAIIVYPFTVVKVTFVGKDSITAGNVSYKFDDASIYEGVAKDDYAVVTAAANTKDKTIAITKADKVAGTVEAVKAADKEYRIDGVWYTDIASVPVSITAGDSVELAVVNGYIFSGKVTEGTSVSDVLYVIDSTAADKDKVLTPALGGTYKGTDTLILLPDGTKTTVKAMRVDATTVTSGVSAADSDLKKVGPAAGLYTYKLNKDNVYELKAVKAAGSSQFGSTVAYVFAAANQPGSTTATIGASAGYVKTTGKLDSKFIADDATIYLVDSATPKYKVVTGKDLKTMANFGTTTSYLTKSVSGLETVKVAVISAAAVFSGTDVSTGYGYVTGSGYAEKNKDGDWTVKFTVWNGEKDVELTATDATAASSADATKYAKGSFVYFTNTATTGEVTDVTAITNEYAITGYDGNKNIALDKTAKTFKDDNKSVVIFVNTADKKGITGGSIEIAQELTSNVYVKNAVAKLTGDDIDVLFVDTANKLTGASYTLALTAATATDGTTTFTPSVAPAAGSVKAGTSLTVTVTTSAAVVKAGGATVAVTMTGADGTVETKNVTFAVNAAVGATQTVTFTMPNQGATIALGSAT